jgi:hypothetical protein
MHDVTFILEIYGFTTYDMGAKFVEKDVWEICVEQQSHSYSIF